MVGVAHENKEIRNNMEYHKRDGTFNYYCVGRLYSSQSPVNCYYISWRSSGTSRFCAALLLYHNNLSFYLIYIKKSSENAALETINKFDAVEDLKKYIKGDGKILLIYYAVMLVLYTIGNLFLPIGNPLTFIFCFPFAISQNIPIPVLSEIVAYII